MIKLLFEVTEEKSYKNKFEMAYSIFANKKQGIVAYKRR